MGRPEPDSKEISELVGLYVSDHPGKYDFTFRDVVIHRFKQWSRNFFMERLSRSAVKALQTGLITADDLKGAVDEMVAQFIIPIQEEALQEVSET